MCVIIVKPANASMPDGYLETCYDNNPDGLGYMYAKDGRVIADKFIPKSFAEVKEVWDQLESVEAIIHLRWLTTGERVKGHCHPFRILKDNAISHDLFFMHNGTFTIDQYEGENDTISFKNSILKPILVNDPNILHSKKFINILEGMDSWSRLAFLSGDGQITLTRERSWVTHEGCKLSNNYSTTPGYRDPILSYYPYSGGYTPTGSKRATEEPKKEVATILPFTRVKGANDALEGDVYSLITQEWEGPGVDMEEVNVLASLPECDLVTWLKEDFDDAVEVFMTKYNEMQLADLISCMGIGFAAKPLEEDVEYLITEYPETAIEFIKERGEGWWSCGYVN